MIDPGSDLTEEQYQSEILTKIMDHYSWRNPPTKTNATLSNGDVYHYDYSYSPVQDITHHENFDPKYKMLVVCGQRDSLKQTIRENMISFVEYHLTAFQLIGLGFAIVLFLIFFTFFLQALNKKISKPIQNLTENIKNPKQFVEIRRNRGGSLVVAGDAENWADGDGRGGRVGSFDQRDSNRSKTEKVDEVQALEELFHSFFGDRTQSNQTTGLVEMTSYETSQNPFYNKEGMPQSMANNQTVEHEFGELARRGSDPPETARSHLNEE